MVHTIEKYRSILKVSLPILAALFVILLMIFSPGTFVWIKEALKPLIYALILAYLMDSAVKFFVARLKVRRVQGILLACLTLVGIAALLFSIAVPKIVENLNAIASVFLDGNIDINEIVSNVKDKIDNQYVQYAADYILETSESIKGQINTILIRLSNVLVRAISNIGSGTLTLATSFIINIYMLVEKDDILARGRRFIYAFFEENKANKIMHVLREGNIIFKSFLTGKMLDSTIVGIICAAAFAVFRIPYALLLGTVIGAFNMIPYFGPIIGSIPVILVSFFVNPPKALTAFIIIIVIQQFDANLLDPRIVGKNVGVSPFWIITAVTVGGNLFGIPGMIFAVPFTVLAKTIIEESVDMRLVEKGMEDFERENLNAKKGNK